MAVAFDARMTTGNSADGHNAHAGSGTSISSTGMTVGASATLLIGMLIMQNSSSVTPTGLAMTWNGVTMALRSNATSTNGTIRETAAIFSLVSPTTGNQTLAASWTGTEAGEYMSAASFMGTDTTTGVATADNITNSNTNTITVTGTTDGATLACSGRNGDTPTMTQTAIWAESSAAPGGGGTYAIGGTSNAHQFTYTTGALLSQVQAGVHIIASAASATLPRSFFLDQAPNRASVY